MGIFDFLKRRTPATTPAAPDALLDAADAQLAAGEPMKAFATLRPRLAYPALVEDATFARAVELFARISDALSAAKLAPLLRTVSARPNDAKALLDAGYQAYEERLFDVAATLLLRANQCAPGVPMIVTEACSALEALLLYDEAGALIDTSGLVEREPFCAYLSGYCALLCGNRERTRSALQRRVLAESSDATVVDVRARLRGMLARADALAAAGLLHDTALTAWHMALNGTLLLHESPHGYPEPMHGRYAFVGDHAQLMHHGIERLHAVLSEHPRRARLRRVVHAPDRASKLLAAAAAARFALPLEAWSAAQGSPPDALVVAWTLEHASGGGDGDAAFAQALIDHAPGQVLWAHGSAWVDPFPFAPDVTTLLYQSITNPFTGGALQPAPDGELTCAAPDERADDAIVADIADAGGADDSISTLAQVTAVRDAVSALSSAHDAAGLFRESGKRSKQRAGSVVPSARFR